MKRILTSMTALTILGAGLLLPINVQATVDSYEIDNNTEILEENVANDAMTWEITLSPKEKITIHEPVEEVEVVQEVEKKQEVKQQPKQESPPKQEAAPQPKQEQPVKQQEPPKQQEQPKKEQQIEQASDTKEEGTTMYVTATAYTAYCDGCSGITYTGIDLRANPNQKVIAVDPNVIPLGSRVWVEGYGTAIAGDIGGAIQGNRIDVFIPNKDEANRFGIKQVKITILD